MNDNITLLICIHNHQPIGNFGWVYEEAYKKAYLPFIDVLEGHPRIKLSLHYSGSLLDWINQNHPEFIKRIKSFVDRGQVEILSGGYYEPIFPLIPEKDRIGQIQTFTSLIKRYTGFSPKGCWLPERVWEPFLVKSLQNAGMSYTIVDDTHFKRCRLQCSLHEAGAEVLNYYITEEENHTLFIFPSSKTLRYCIPFKLPEETIRLLRSVVERSSVCITFADDGEKFGLWPHTYKWVYQEKWLENFFKALEDNGDWIKLSTFGEYIENVKPTSLVYLPPCSYDEMLEWSGGYFRNFLVKYPEANNMHKKMLYVSDKISRQKPVTRDQKKRFKQAIQELYKGQTNCAYWHGVFGGLYLRHLRNAVYNHLIEAEKITDDLVDCGRASFEAKIFDFNKDGYAEAILESKALNIYIDPAYGGSIFELDYKPVPVNICNVIARRQEPYHKKISAPKHTNTQTDKPMSIHDLVGVKEKGLENLLVYDRHRRNSLLDHIFSKDVTLNDFAYGDYKDLYNFTGSSYRFQNHTDSISLVSGELTKSIKIIEDSLIQIDYELKNIKDETSHARFGIEFNLNVRDPKFLKIGELKNIDTLTLKDSDSSLNLKYNFDKPQDLWFYPIETVSESEAGLEKTYQGLCLLFHSMIDISPDDSWRVSLCIMLKNG